MSSVNHQSKAAAALDKLNAAWLAQHPDRDERIQARRDADAVHFAQRQELAEARVRADREDPGYFEADGSYWVAYKGEVEQVGPIEKAWIEAQESKGNHVLAETAGRSALADYRPGNALAASQEREHEWAGFSR
ncbi:hypothetical protein [Nocardia nova]|uniref:hypothetical protein n=1 Tax=Nocardia nova TaxID=37330 RepID=UPI0033D13160